MSTQPLGKFQCEDGAWFYGAMQINGKRTELEIIPHDYFGEQRTHDYSIVRRGEPETTIGKAWEHEIPNGGRYLEIRLEGSERCFRLNETAPGEWALAETTRPRLVVNDLLGKYERDPQPKRDRDKDGPDMDRG